MVFNADKCHYIPLCKDTENIKFYFDGNPYLISKKETILGIIINNDTLLDSHKRVKKLPKS